MHVVLRSHFEKCICREHPECKRFFACELRAEWLLHKLVIKKLSTTLGELENSGLLHQRAQRSEHSKLTPSEHSPQKKGLQSFYKQCMTSDYSERHSLLTGWFKLGIRMVVDVWPFHGQAWVSRISGARQLQKQGKDEWAKFQFLALF